jgi:hypothetical protein
LPRRKRCFPDSIGGQFRASCDVQEIVVAIRRHRHSRFRTPALVAVAALLWLAASVPSGFGIVQIAVFAGPGMVLALAISWTSYANARRDWDWRHGLRAIGLGAAFFPPFVGLFFAWSGSFGSEVLVTLLVYSAWMALLCGFLLAMLNRARAT